LGLLDAPSSILGYTEEVQVVEVQKEGEHQEELK